MGAERGTTVLVHPLGLPFTRRNPLPARLQKNRDVADQSRPPHDGVFVEPSENAEWKKRNKFNNFFPPFNDEKSRKNLEKIQKKWVCKNPVFFRKNRIFFRKNLVLFCKKIRRFITGEFRYLL